METATKQPRTKTHWKKVFNSDYLGSCDLEDGKDLKAIIKSVTAQKAISNAYQRIATKEIALRKSTPLTEQN